MHELLSVCRDNGIQTRVVNCFLDVDFSLCENEEKFMEEFYTLHLAHQSLQQWFERLQNKDKGENTAVLEILIELYKKVVDLEKRIQGNQKKLIVLDSKSVILGLGHGVMWIEKDVLEVGKSYYLRFVLPNFSDRIIAIFAKALSKNALHVTKMHSRDIQDFDSYVVAKEMEKIRWQKHSKRKEDE